MIGHSQDDEIERALAELPGEQEEELESLLEENEQAFYWSSRRRLRWLWQKAIGKGWLMGPA
jgi:hypothetical protein